MPTPELREAWEVPEVPEVQEARRELLDPRHDLSLEDRLLRLEARLEALQRGDLVYAEWHEIGTASEPAFQSSWVNVGVGHALAAYRRDGLGVVRIKGLVKDGTIGYYRVFTLPVGFRPAHDLNFATITYNDTIGRLAIEADGDVIAQAGSTTWFSLCCSFYADNPENLLFR